MGDLSGQEVLDQRITVQATDIALSAILDSIAGQSGVRFAYNKKKVPLQERRTIRAKDEKLTTVLTDLFKGLAIEFAASGNQISLFRSVQPFYTISGHVRDSASGEALIGANVYEYAQLIGASTNEYGFFSISLPAGRQLLKTSFIGFQDQLDTIHLEQDLDLEILLSTGRNLMEVLVTGDHRVGLETSHEYTANGESRIDTREVGAYSSILGENDVLKIAQMMPGVVFGTEGSSGLHVQGGSPDQNLILLDGVPLYNPTHLLGFVSIFNAKAINSASIYRSGFPARFSGRLSSVVDVRMKEGNDKSYHGGLSLGIISASGYLEGPIKEGKSSFIVSGRRTWLDLIAASAQVAEQEVRTNYNFHDLNMKANYRLSKKDRLLVSLYSGRDRFIDKGIATDRFFDTIPPDIKAETELTWGNKALALRWNRTLTPKLFANSTLFYGNFQYDVKTLVESERYIGVTGNSTRTVTEEAASSNIRDFGVKIDFDYIPNYEHHFRFGGGYTLHDYIPGLFRGLLEVRGQQTVREEGALRVIAHEGFVYLEDEMVISPKIKLYPGLHITLLHSDRTLFWRPQLRFRLNYEFKARQRFSFAYSGMTQLVHLLVNTSSALLPPTGLWVPSTRRVNPGLSHQFSADYERFVDERWIIQAGVYYKRMKGLTEFKDGASLINNTSDWESQIESGRGWSYGATAQIQKKGKRISGRISYSLGWARRKFEHLNAGQSFPYRYDRRHNLNISLIHRWQGRKNKEKDIGFVWILTSGHLVDFPTAWYRDINGRPVAYYSVKNNYRLPTYHRLDFAKSNRRKTKRENFRTWRWGIYNLYGRSNFYTAGVQDNEVTSMPEVVGRSLFPIPVPFIQYEFDF